MEEFKQEAVEQVEEERPVKEKREKRLHLGLRGKMTLGMGICLTVVLLISGSLLLRQANAKISDLTETNIAEQVNTIKMQTEKYFGDFISALQVLDNMDSVNRMVREADLAGPGFRFENSPQMQPAMRDLKNALSTFPDGVMNLFVACVTNSEVMRANGTMSDPSYVVSERPWWKELEKSGEQIVTGAYHDANTDELVVTLALPIYSGSRLIGAVGMDIKLADLTQIMSQVKVGETGYIVVYDSDHAIVYHPDSSLLLKNIDETDYSSNMKEAVNNSQNVEKIVYQRAGTTYHASTIHIPSTDWQVIGCMPEAEFEEEIHSFGNTIILCFLGLAVLLLGVTLLNINRIVRPIKQLRDVADQLAQGELHVEIDTSGDDEIAELATSTSHIVDRLKTYIAYIDEVAEVLEDMGQRNLVFTLEQDYVGEFGKLKTAMNDIQASLSGAMFNILEAAEEVNNSSGQMASGAQALAQGATEQASTVQELAAAVETLTTQAGEGAAKAGEANKDMSRIGSKVGESNQQMQEMLRAMSNIEEQSAEIEKIVKASEDIAFQTNILALNAAVEAARAGAAGKGFAVVADEVRNLAGKSADSANTIAQLIQNTIAAVKEGVEIANSTAGSLDEVAGDMDGVVTAINRIVEDYQGEVENLSQIAEGISQVSAVVQTNSATAEESAATAEELAGQVNIMKDLVSTFRLDDRYQDQSHRLN